MRTAVHPLPTYSTSLRHCTQLSTGEVYLILHTMASRSVVRQQARKKQLYNGRYYAAICKQQQRNGVFGEVSAEML
jgi:hypothetical protein